LGLPAAELLRLPALAGELARYLGRLWQHGGTLLTVGVLVLATLLCAGLCGSLERLDQLRREPRGARAQREDGFADLDDVLTQFDAFNHVRVRLLDALVGTPATQFDGLCDRVEALAELLWELSGVL